ncbi:MAG: nicotianamine synthase family protein [Deltaproteobacteria bacterium]|nr:nicotianamine synthase family protein [Deltaproteobacteria bacterium]
MHDINYFHEHELKEHDFLGCCKDCRNSLNIIKPHILAFAERIQQYTREMLEKLPPDELYRLYQLLDDLAHMDAGVHLAGLILEEDEIKSVLPLIRSYYAAFFAIHEAHLAKRLLASDDPWETLRKFPLYSRYEALIKSQAEALPELTQRRLIFIGCGPVPLSLILMNRLYQTRCVGLDTSPDSVDLARAVVETLGLEKDITIVHGDETALWDLDWNAVLVAALAEPKERIFQNLRRILPERDSDIPVIYRTYTGMRAVLYAPVNPDHLTDFRTIQEIFPTGRVNNTTVLAELADP